MVLNKNQKEWRTQNIFFTVEIICLIEKDTKEIKILVQ